MLGIPVLLLVMVTHEQLSPDFSLTKFILLLLMGVSDHQQPFFSIHRLDPSLLPWHRVPQAELDSSFGFAKCVRELLGSDPEQHAAELVLKQKRLD